MSAWATRRGSTAAARARGSGRATARTLTQAILSTTDPFILTPPERGAFEHLRATARLTRYGLDAYAYARLAAGTIDMVTETGLKSHDVAALIPGDRRRRRRGHRLAGRACKARRTDRCGRQSQDTRRGAGVPAPLCPLINTEAVMTEFTQFRLEIDNGVAVATFTRPEKMNTFNPAMMTEMIRLFDLTDADDSVRAVVITGSGKAFCAGADLSSGADTFNYQRRDASKEVIANGVRRDGGGRLTLRIFNSLKPVIAACNGAAVGVGVTMQLPMDFRLASTNARYGFVFARRGIVPEACSSWFLPRLVGVPTALEWIYSGRVFDAQEAKDKGLVQSIHAPDELVPAAIDFARRMIEKSAPVSVAVSRQNGLGHDGR